MMQSYQGASKVLYVGNLDRRCTEEFLKQVFGKIAPVERCKMIFDQSGSDPYCFVEFQDHDSAKTALETMNGRRVFDQDIKVNWATSNTGMRKDTSNHFHIFVGDLPNEMTTCLLKSSFEKFGEISCLINEYSKCFFFPGKWLESKLGTTFRLDAEMFTQPKQLNDQALGTDARVVNDQASGKSKGYGFVSFVNKISAETAIKDMNGKTLNGKQIRTNWASRKPQPPQVKRFNLDDVLSKASAYNRTVYVGNLPEGISSDRLKNTFQKYGVVDNIRLLADKGYAFVFFADHMEAAEAICGVQGENIQGNVLKCSWGKEEGSQPGNMGQYYQQHHSHHQQHQQHQQPYYYPQGYYAQQQQQQQPQYQQMSPYMQMQQHAGYYYPQYPQAMPMAHNYPGAGGQHMQGQGGGQQGQQGPNGVHNSGAQGGNMGYSM